MFKRKYGFGSCILGVLLPDRKTDNLEMWLREAKDQVMSHVVVLIFIPLGSRQHFVPFEEINSCILADICNHTWIPECGYYAEKNFYRIFIDECDMHEYNCDNDLEFAIMNYSDCFSASASAMCPTVPSLMTRVEGFYIYHADGRRYMRFMTTEPRKKSTYYTLPTTATRRKTARTTQWKDRRRYTPQKTGSYRPWSDLTASFVCNKGKACGRMTKKLPALPRTTAGPPPELEKLIRMIAKKFEKQTTKRTTKRTKKRVTTKPTTQVVRTGTIGTVVLKNVTVWKNGKMVYKVIKGYKTPIMTTNFDSDFLE